MVDAPENQNIVLAWADGMQATLDNLTRRIGFRQDPELQSLQIAAHVLLTTVHQRNCGDSLRVGTVIDAIHATRFSGSRDFDRSGWPALVIQAASCLRCNNLADLGL